MLYQLSYLAGQKNRPGLSGPRAGNLSGEPNYQLPRPTRSNRVDHVSNVHSRALRAPESDAKGTALAVINVIRSPLPAASTPGPQTPYVAKRRHLATPHDFSSGGGIRTRDLRVMSPTSYQTAPPRNRAPSLSLVRGGVNPV